MKIHHLNCISSCPLGGHLMDGKTHGLTRGELTNHSLLVETSSGLVLVDTGFGLNDVHNPKGRFNNWKEFIPISFWYHCCDIR